MADKIRNVKVKWVVDNSDLKATDLLIDQQKKSIDATTQSLAKMSTASDKAFNTADVKEYNVAVQTGTTQQKRSIEDLSKVYANLKTVIKNSYDIDQLNKYQAELVQVKNEAKDLGVNLDKANGKAKDTGSSFGKLGSAIKTALGNSPLGGLVSDLDNASASAKGVSEGIGGVGKSASGSAGGVATLGNALKVGVLGVLGAIIVAFTAVVAFIKQTDEGATKFQATMDGLGASTDVLTGRLASLGDTINESFNEATGATGGFLEKATSVGKYLPGFIGDIFRAGSAVGNSGLGKDMKAAYDAAYKLSIELDATQDAMRGLEAETTDTTLSIQALIKETKNRSIDIGDRLDIVSQAQALENTNLQKNFDLQKQYYDNISRVNLLKLETINTDKKAQVSQVAGIVSQIKSTTNAKDLLDLYKQQLKAQEGLRSINDDAAQKQVDALKNVIELAGRSEVVQEKYASIQAGLIEKDIADRGEGVKSVERTRQAAALNTISDEKKLAAELFDIQIDSLKAQKQVFIQSRDAEIAVAGDDADKKKNIYEKYSHDISALDLQIATDRKKYNDDSDKAERDRQAKAKADAEKAAKALQTQLSDSYREEKALNSEAYNDRQKTLSEQYTKGLITQKQFNTQKIALDYEQKRNELENDQAYYKNQLDNGNLSFSDQVTARENYNKITAALYAEDEKNHTASLDAKFAATQKDLQRTATAAQITGSILTSIGQISASNDASLAVFQKGLAIVTIGINAAVGVSNAIAAAKGATGIDYIIQVGAGVAAVLAAIAQAKQILSSSGSAPAPPQLQSVPSSSSSNSSSAPKTQTASDVKQFADGVIDLQGGVRGVDSIKAMLMPGESVMTTEETRMYKPLLMAIRNKQISPEVLNSLGSSGSNFAVTVDNKELVEAYKNRPVHAFHLDENGFAHHIINKAKRKQLITSKYSM